MKHWASYLEKQHEEYLAPSLPAGFIADSVVVIPCYDEKELHVTLQSLRDCEMPDANTMALIVINSSVRSSDEVVAQNRKTYREVQDFAQRFSTDRLLFVPVIFEQLPRKHAGVGLARKIGMDLAVDYFHKTGHPNGILISLDADCTVSPNYLRRIREAFGDDKVCGTVHNFHHRVENNDPEIEKAVRQYETYIRYFEDALRFAGFPYYYHTIGSAFAVTADAYVRVGGMGRQQGGEDFYFLQKIFSLGKSVLLNDVFVYPMARFSERVPFGTGPALQKILQEPGGQMKVYSMDAFVALKQFFAMKDAFFKQTDSFIEANIKSLHPALLQFIIDNNVLADIADCNRNTSTLQSYQKRFFHHFNAFRIIKFLNFSHPEMFTPETLKANLDKYAKSVGN